ncbi:hypothetical protein LBBP_03738 [Leptospira borgpetersenii serovar Ballum]|uniref:Uncharacterized protein n=1 Tax=Leptospira borgpetersenii serovar Ballum TaxID=280505 RepID=A0A0S2IX85_LEPBO|nr:hypothetical protein LBBP_03738 [Leptospira borgpetersenii serovar Ballum]
MRNPGISRGFSFLSFYVKIIDLDVSSLAFSSLFFDTFFLIFLWGTHVF